MARAAAAVSWTVPRSLASEAERVVVGVGLGHGVAGLLSAVLHLWG